MSSMRYSLYRKMNHNQINKPQINRLRFRLYGNIIKMQTYYQRHLDHFSLTFRKETFFVFLVILVMEPGTLSVSEERDVILIFTPTFTTKALVYGTKFARNYTHHTTRCHNLEDHSTSLHRRENLHSYTRTPQKGKAIPLQAWTGPEVSRSLRIPDFKTIGT
jgi:hypothetical protein